MLNDFRSLCNAVIQFENERITQMIILQNTVIQYVINRLILHASNLKVQSKAVYQQSIYHQKLIPILPLHCIGHYRSDYHE